MSVYTADHGKMRSIWYTQDGREQFFRLSDDPSECHDRIAKPEEAERIKVWRKRLIEELKDRPEGFSDGKRLIPGCEYPADGRKFHS
jgi:arylsulfatase